MRISSFAIAALELAIPAFTTTEPVTWDQTYDNPALPLTNVACSNGPNGLLGRGFTNLGSLPTFPYLGGAFPVSWGSPECGSCWKLTYGSTTIRILAVDHAGEGFNLSKEAMLKLAGQDGVNQGRINVEAEQVAASECGM